MSTNRIPSSRFEGVVKLLWGVSRVGTRGPKPIHALGDVLDAAIRVADEEGLGAVSMQRLAQELGFTKMAVYRYVPGRAELIALMTDRAIGSPPSSFDGKSWRNRMEKWAHAVFTVFQAHPWGIEATTGHRIPGPLEIAWVEAGLAILADTGLDGPDRLDVLGVISGHLRFMAVHAGGNGPTIGLEAEVNALMSRAMHGREKEFPQFTAAMSAAANNDAEDRGLSFGLTCILDGVQRRLG